MFKGRHFDQSVILLCIRWYLAYGLSLRDLREMMAERGISVDHSTIHRWVVHFAPLLMERFNRRARRDRQMACGRDLHQDARAMDVPLSRHRQRRRHRRVRFSEYRDLPAAKRFLTKALARHGRPDRIVIDGSQTNREAIVSCDATSRLQDCSRRPSKPIRIRQSQYLNNCIEQDHRRIKRRVRPMLGRSPPMSAMSLCRSPMPMWIFILAAPRSTSFPAQLLSRRRMLPTASETWTRCLPLMRRSPSSSTISANRAPRPPHRCGPG